MSLVDPEDLARHIAIKRHANSEIELTDISVEHLGSGGWGDAFAIDDTVYKVTGSITEAIYALELKQKKLQSCVEIHDVHLYKDGENFYFIIEQEKVISSEETSDIAEMFAALDTVSVSLEDDIDFILEKLDEQKYPYDRIIDLIVQGTDIAQNLYLHGFWMADIHEGNVGIRKSEEGDKLVLFDQMNTSLESSLADELFETKDLVGILARNVGPEALSTLNILNKYDVDVTKNTEEITEFMEDIIYAFSTDDAYEFLQSGDWCAGGCLSFAKILLEELKSSLGEYTDLKVSSITPEIECVKNFNTGNIEHFYVRLGSLILDAAGVHNGEPSTYINNFIKREAPHLANSTLKTSKTCDSDLREDFVDAKELHACLKDSGLLPSSSIDQYEIAIPS